MQCNATEREAAGGSMPVQIGFTALSLSLNASDSLEKPKWLDLEVMHKENDKMVGCLLSYVMLTVIVPHQYIAIESHV